MSRNAANRRPHKPAQLVLPLRSHGGARKGAGRKPAGDRAGVVHTVREVLSDREPVHVTMCVRDHVWNLRSRRCFGVFSAALEGIAKRADELRVVHFSVQGNHLHLIIEAANGTALSNGMNALGARFAKGLNALMGRRGKVFADRFHAHLLHTPAEVRNALAYVLGNTASHARRRGGSAVDTPDRYATTLDRPLTRPRTWLLSRAGPPRRS